MFLGIWVMIWKLCQIKIPQDSTIFKLLNPQTSIFCRYRQDWLIPYIVLLIIATTIEMIALITPLYFLHKLMLRNKDKRSKKLNYITRKIIDIKNQIEQVSTQQEYEQLDFHLSRLHQKYFNIMQAPTWSINTKDVLQVLLNYSIPSIMTILQFIQEVGKLTKVIFP
jgi:hypothetical protein